MPPKQSQMIREIGFAKWLYFRCCLLMPRSIVQARRVGWTRWLYFKSAERSLRRNSGLPIVYLKTYIGGHRVAVRRGTSDLNVYYQVFLDREYAPALDRVGSGVLIDCGANVGYASVYCALLNPGMKIFAIEPDRENFAVLQSNVAAFPTIKTFQLAIWDEATVLTPSPATAHRGQEWGRTFERKAPTGGEGEVPGITIANFMLQHTGGRADILKVDIEGAEVKMLSGANSPWTEGLNRAVFELHNPEAHRLFRETFPESVWRYAQSGELTIADRRG